MWEDGRRVGVIGRVVVVLAAAGTCASCSWKALPVGNGKDAAADVVVDLAKSDSQDVPPDGSPEIQPDAQSDVPGDRDSATGSDTPVDMQVDVVGDRADVDAGRCTRPLAEVTSACPATYDLIGDRACAAFSYDGGTSTSSCGSFLIFALRGPFDTFVCYYDATSRALVAVSQCTDYSAYCGGADYCYWAGVPVGACELSNLTLTGLRSSICADAGSTDGHSPG